jgi:hypothetical protein
MRMAPVAALHSRSIFRHDDVSRHAAPGRSAGNRGSVVSARGRHDAMRSFGIGQRKDRVRRTANFERTRFLKVVALEEQLRASDGVKRMRSENRSAVDARSDTRVRLADGVPTGWLKTERFDSWRCAHGSAPALMRIFSQPRVQRLGDDYGTPSASSGFDGQSFTSAGAGQCGHE